MPAKWALNTAQWTRTALTDVFHAMGQSEKGRKPSLVQRYKAIAAQLDKLDQELQMVFKVPPPTGVGRARRKKKGKE